MTIFGHVEDRVDLIAMGSKLAELRRLHKVSASALAEAVGISRGYLSRVENGRQVPSLVIYAIAQKFGVELDYFFGSSSLGQVAVHRAVSSVENSFPPKSTFTYELCARSGITSWLTLLSRSFDPTHALE